MAEAYDYVMLELGYRDGGLTEEKARTSAQAYRLAHARYPAAKFGLFIAGYDDDPRELWEIPEVAAHVRCWAALAGLTDVASAIAGGIENNKDCASVWLLHQCGVFEEAA